MSGVKKRSIILEGVKTSVTLEDQYWAALAEIAIDIGTTRPKLIASVAETRDGNLSSALRVYTLEHLNRMAREKRDAA